MKTNEREFRIYEGERPKVLLLGNGLCRAFGGKSWDDLLDEIKDHTQYTQAARNYLMPMPLKAVMLTNNMLSSAMHDITRKRDSWDSEGNGKKLDWNNFVYTTNEMQTAIRDLIGNRFDYVLTTNYSYEIEATLSGRNLSPDEIKGMMSFHEVKAAQTRFLINTYNLVGSVPVWHIHGEARKPDSMVIGNYYYGKSLRKCVERLDGWKKDADDRTGRGKTKEFMQMINLKKGQKIGSWIDAFVLGDVYILGLGLDFSELDLWWLIEYKSNCAQFTGKTVFYDPELEQAHACLMDADYPCEKGFDYVDTRQCRNYLLHNTYHVEINHLGSTIRKDTRNEDYRSFYLKAIEEIKKECP